jgi:uncharacterized delta-60 repeat protein
VFSGSLDTGYAMVLQADGRTAPGVNSYVNLARFKTNGSLHSTFGTGGGVIAQAGAASGYITVLTLQPHGKIVVARSSQNGNYKFLAQRYNSDGSLDNSFGTGGTTPSGILARAQMNLPVRWRWLRAWGW